MEPTCREGYRDLLIEFTNGSVVQYRVYESMYDRAKDAFYQGAAKYDFILGYVIHWASDIHWHQKLNEVLGDSEFPNNNVVGMPTERQIVSTKKSFINMRNVCHIQVLRKCNGHG